MGIVKNVVNDLVSTVEDLFAALLGIVVIVFMVGEWYGLTFNGTPQLYYPFYLFISLLLYKLVKDMVARVKKK